MSKKNALVTGGTGGIGTAICQALTDAGYHVIAGYSKGGYYQAAQAWQAQQQQQGYEIKTAYGDVSDYDSAGAMIANIEQQWGPIDILVNNAGITRDASLRKMTPAHWLAVINTNLNSAFNVTHHLINGMCIEALAVLLISLR